MINSIEYILWVDIQSYSAELEDHDCADQVPQGAAGECVLFIKVVWLF